MPLFVGSHLGAYEVLAFIGASGMGEVYRARDTKLKRDYAKDPGRMFRFQPEAEVLASLNRLSFSEIPHGPFSQGNRRRTEQTIPQFINQFQFCENYSSDCLFTSNLY